MNPSFKREEMLPVAPKSSNMDKELLPNSTVFSPQNPSKSQHLAPLSRYSRMIFSNPKDDRQPTKTFSDRLVNIKIEILNKCARKRYLDDSGQDEGYETPAKKAFSPKALSPDLGCVMDLCSPADSQNPSPFVSQAALLDKPQLVEIEETVDTRYATCGPSEEPGGNEGHVRDVFRCSEVPVNLAPYFDVDIDDILCLSPLATETAARLSDNEESKDLKSNTRQSQPVLVPTVTHGQELRSGDGKGKEEQKEQMVENDSVLGSLNPNVDLLEGDAEELLDIGPPLLESSICHSFTVNVGTGSEQRTHVSGKLHDGVTVSGGEVWSHVCQTTVYREEDSLDTSYDSTLPLQVQVKSVVVVVQHQNVKPNDNRGSQTARYSSSARSQRPVVFNRRDEWEREKNTYVYLVSKHLNENPASENDAMSELQTLMSSVAAQAPGSNGRQWQHPSDFTRRNYQERFKRHNPKVSLREWRAMNGDHKRFSKVPKIFRRN